MNIRLEASSILNIVDVQKYYGLAAIFLTSCIQWRQEHHKGVHPPFCGNITLLIKYPSQKAANIVVAIAVIVAAVVTPVP